MQYRIYAFLDMRGRPYYIGKTNNLKRRKKEHLDEAKKGNNLPKYNKLRKILRNGGKFRVRTLAQALKEKDAYLIERTFIKEYNRRGFNLTNMTHGGPDEKRIKKVKNKKIKTRKRTVFKKRKRI